MTSTTEFTLSSVLEVMGHRFIKKDCVFPIRRCPMTWSTEASVASVLEVMRQPVLLFALLNLPGDVVESPRPSPVFGLCKGAQRQRTLDGTSVGSSDIGWRVPSSSKRVRLIYSAAPRPASAGRGPQHARFPGGVY